MKTPNKKYTLTTLQSQTTIKINYYKPGDQYTKNNLTTINKPNNINIQLERSIYKESCHSLGSKPISNRGPC